MGKKYIVQEDNKELGVSKGDLFYEADNNYYCYKYDEEVSDGSILTTSSYKHFPKELVENNELFVNTSKSTLPEVEKEASIEEVKQELRDEEVVEPLVKKLKVILSFPGGKEGEIFEYNKEANAYIKQTPVDEDEYISALLNGSVSALTVAEVNENFDYFEDITPRIMKTKDEVIMKIADLAEQKLGLEKSIVDSTNKLFVNMSKRQIKTLKAIIEALEWSIGEGKDFIVE